MNEGKNNEDFATYKVNDYHFMLFGAYDRLPICMYVGRLQIVCKTSEKNGVHRRGWPCLPQNKNCRDDAIAPAVHLIMIPIEKKYIRSKLPLIRVKR